MHFGHLRAVLEVAEGFPLDECYLIPAATPPHKLTGNMVDADTRLDMIRLAVTEHPGLKISDVELKRSGPSYTIDTVRFFKNQFPKTSRLYLIMGLDAFLEFDTWKSHRALLDLAAVIVTSRPAPQQEPIVEKWQRLHDYLSRVISHEYVASGDYHVFTHPSLLPIHTFEVTMLDISSSKIRSIIRQGRSAKYLLPDNVLTYIAAQGLYL